MISILGKSKTSNSVGNGGRCEGVCNFGQGHQENLLGKEILLLL